MVGPFALHSAIGRILDEDSPLHQAPDVYTRDGYTLSSGGTIWSLVR
jgi:hypothetical protein